jgi:hypothetical protein
VFQGAPGGGLAIELVKQELGECHGIRRSGYTRAELARS